MPAGPNSDASQSSSNERAVDADGVGADAHLAGKQVVGCRECSVVAEVLVSREVMLTVGARAR